ncbi:MAG: nucleotidyltransferase family protein [Mariprofundaceae bacterium]|nr:nucleotidyltransferase family protein [Mariprofundaceae bacterium]
MYIEHAIILAAGLGTRLKWLTKHQPKAMMKIQDEPSIIHVIQHLSRQGIRHIVINVHHHAQQLMELLGHGEHLGIRIDFSHEKHLLDSGGGVRTAMQYLPKNVPFIVHNADIITDIDIQSLSSLTAHHTCALAVVNNPNHHPEGDFSCHHHQISLTGQPRYTFSGVSLWYPEILQAFPCNTPFSLVDVIHKQIKQQSCEGFIHRGQWFDIGRPRDLMRANQHWRAS